MDALLYTQTQISYEPLDGALKALSSIQVQCIDASRTPAEQHLDKEISSRLVDVINNVLFSKVLI